MKTGHLIRICWATLIMWSILFAKHTTAQVETYPNWTRALAWSPDSSKIALSTMNGSIQIFDSATGQQLREWQANDGYPLALSWNPGSSQLAVSEGYTIKIWNIADGSLLRVFTGYQDVVLPVEWSPNGSEVASVSTESNPNILVWDVNTGDEVFSTQVPLAMSLNWSHNGQLMAIGSLGKIEIWNVQTFQLVQTLELDDVGYVTWVDWSPDNALLASVDGLARQSYRVRVWDIGSGQVTTEYSEHSDVINLVAWSPDGTSLGSASTDGTIHIWDADTGQTLRVIQGDDRLYTVDWSPDGTKLAYGDLNGELVIIPMTSGAVCTPTQTVSDIAGLITAINTANANPAADVIGLTAGMYTFTSINNNRNALPRITTDITICSTDGATLTRSPSAPQFRFFEVRSNGNLTLENLTFTGGSLGVDYDGGAIFNLGTLTVNGVTFSNNQAGVGGAIASEDGQVTVTDSTFTDNSSSGDGGAIHSEADLLIETSTFTGNTADDAGAVNNDGGNLTVTDSTFTDNSADDGGAIYNDAGTLTLSGSTFTNNAGDAGGALDNLDGQAQIDSSTFTGNSASDGGAIRNYGGTIILSTSIFTGNMAEDDGGALNNSGGTLTITDTRLETNTATTRGGAIYSNSSGAMSAHNSCISGNSATAVYAASTGLQDFTGNWWGAANGPGGAGPGTGDTINSKINHASFLTAECPLP